MINDTRTKFSYDPETHTTTCKRVSHNKSYIGKAKCHPNDYEFESKLVGEHYAYTRSMVQELCENRDALVAELKALKHLYNILEQNPRVHYDSIECYTIRRQMKLLERDIADTKHLIHFTKKDMREMIAEKDAFYSKVRALRKKENPDATEPKT